MGIDREVVISYTTPLGVAGGYLELYRDPVLARRLRDVSLDSAEYPESVARTWLLSFTQLSNGNYSEVLWCTTKHLWSDLHTYL